jgi:ketosteroid isomerase-like protein
MSVRVTPTAGLPIACLSATLLAACGPGALLRRADTAKVVDAIKVDELHWNTDYKTGDAARIASHYASGAVLMNAGAPAAVGQAAIRAAISQRIARPGFSRSFTSSRVDVATSGDLAAARGSYAITAVDSVTGAPVTETGSYVTVYKPGPDRVWRAVWDIATPDAPRDK